MNCEQSSLKRILIVESSRTAAGELSEALRGFPAELQFAGSRSEAVEVSLRGRFSLCLISHGLSDGSGLLLLRDLFTNSHETAGVLLSQHPDLWVIQQAIEAGYMAVLGKPPDAAQLSEILHKVFGDVSRDWGVRGPDSRADVMRSKTHQVPELAEIAALSNADIRQRLSSQELIGIIRVVEYPFAGKERLEYFDRDTLERVVCLIRRWSQQRLERLRQEQLEARSEQAAGAAESDHFSWRELAAAG